MVCFAFEHIHVVADAVAADGGTATTKKKLIPVTF